MFKSENLVEIRSQILKLNFCHDASLRKISFYKIREVDEHNGSLIYPFDDLKEMMDCDIELELILNSYEGAKKDQIVILEFKDTTSFSFYQTPDFDYSDIYELEVTENQGLQFSFYAIDKKIKTLSLTCGKFISKEL